MKYAKKMLALVLTVIMCMSMMSMVAFAAEENVTITVTNSDPSDTGTNQRTYHYYRIFHASLVDAGDATKGASYYLLSPDEDSQKEKLDALAIDGTDVFSFIKTADGSRWVMSVNAKSETNSDGIDFAAATEEGKANTVKLAEALKSMVDENADLFTKSAAFNAGVGQTVEQGYYLITSSLGTKMILDTYVTTAITEKNDYPSNTKSEDKETAAYGETVTYTVEVTIPASAAEKEIKVVDTISKGLTLNSAITVSAKTGETITTPTAEVVFTENGSYSPSPADGSKQYIATIAAADVKANAGKTLVLTYTAVVNSDAVAGTAEVNKAHIEYDNYVSVDKTAEVTTHGFTLRKINGADVTEGMDDSAKLSLTALNGAQFSLWTGASSTAENNTEIKVVAVDASGDVIQAAGIESAAIARYRVAQSDGEKAQAVYIRAGEATIDGLAAGTYYLQEEVAPAGYNKLTERTAVEVNAATSADGVDIAIENNTGAELPSTGGTGTTSFYVLGVILAAGAAVLLITRKRVCGANR